MAYAGEMKLDIWNKSRMKPVFFNSHNRLLRDPSEFILHDHSVISYSIILTYIVDRVLLNLSMTSTPCSLETGQPFRGIYRHHIQSHKGNQARNSRSGLQAQKSYSPETSASPRTMWRYNLEDRTVHSHCRKNLKSKFINQLNFNGCLLQYTAECYIFILMIKLNIF